jgi:hypothetical protein
MVPKDPNSTLIVDLPEGLHKFVQGVVASSDCEGPSEYVLKLIREDWLRRRTTMESELLEAMQDRPLDISEEELASEEGLLSILERKIAEAQLSRPKISAA